MIPDTQETIAALRVEATAKRNNARDIIAQAEILETAAAQLEGTLETQNVAAEKALAKKDATIETLTTALVENDIAIPEPALEDAPE